MRSINKITQHLIKWSHKFHRVNATCDIRTCQMDKYLQRNSSAGESSCIRGLERRVNKFKHRFIEITANRFPLFIHGN